MVRAAGIEPALLSERDFESDETTAFCRRNLRSKTRLLPEVRVDNGNQPYFGREGVRVCANEGRARAWQELVAALKNAVVVNIAKFSIAERRPRLAPL